MRYVDAFYMLYIRVLNVYRKPMCTKSTLEKSFAVCLSIMMVIFAEQLYVVYLFDERILNVYRLALARQMPFAFT
jgi:hypothetical protein